MTIKLQEKGSVCWMKTVCLPQKKGGGPFVQVSCSPSAIYVLYDVPPSETQEYVLFTWNVTTDQYEITTRWNVESFLWGTRIIEAPIGDKMALVTCRQSEEREMRRLYIIVPPGDERYCTNTNTCVWGILRTRMFPDTKESREKHWCFKRHMLVHGLFESVNNTATYMLKCEEGFIVCDAKLRPQ